MNEKEITMIEKALKIIKQNKGIIEYEDFCTWNNKGIIEYVYVISNECKEFQFVNGVCVRVWCYFKDVE